MEQVPVFQTLIKRAALSRCCLATFRKTAFVKVLNPCCSRCSVQAQLFSRNFEDSPRIVIFPSLQSPQFCHRYCFLAHPYPRQVRGGTHSLFKTIAHFVFKAEYLWQLWIPVLFHFFLSLSHTNQERITRSRRRKKGRTLERGVFARESQQNSGAARG